MNQTYQIGDKVIVYGIGHLIENKDNELEIEFRKDGDLVGVAFVPSHFVSKVDDDYLINRVGFIVGVSWSFSKKTADYNVIFEDENVDFSGFATVQDSILNAENQKLKASEIEALNKGGILA